MDTKDKKKIYVFGSSSEIFSYFLPRCFSAFGKENSGWQGSLNSHIQKKLMSYGHYKCFTYMSKVGTYTVSYGPFYRIGAKCGPTTRKTIYKTIKYSDIDIY